MSRISRREFVKASAAFGVILAAGPRWARASSSSMADFGVSRASKLFPGDGTFVAHSDLHNHTLFSDGAGTAAEAFDKMRASGLDIAAVTDHAIMGKDAGEVCHQTQPCTVGFGISETSWQQTKQFADAANEDDAFVAMRGFEWSTGTIGHANVWFTDDWTDAMRSRSLVTPRAIPEIAQLIPGFKPVGDGIRPVTDQTPELATMDGFYDWLASPHDRALLGGGAEGLGGFNHPNLYGDFTRFALDPRARAQIVSCEAINGYDDYIFGAPERNDNRPDPLNACLNAGWRVGLLGTTDEHSRNFGGLAGKGRGGLWLRALTREGVREALAARRFFATRELGLRLDASANGARMGGDVPLPGGRGLVRFLLDIDKSDWAGKPLNVQVLRPGSTSSTLAWSDVVFVPSASGPVIEIELPLDRADGDWVFLRISDPSGTVDGHATGPLASLGRGIAYSSPWWLAVA